jgi:ankyrin repeat protein
MTALHIAAFFGLLPLVDSLLADGHADEIRYLDSWKNQPLHWADALGHLDVCERLLERGADINNGCLTGSWTLLHMAAGSGQIEVTKSFLNYRRPSSAAADINAVAKEVGASLTLALSSRHIGAAVLFLDRGADPTLMGKSSCPYDGRI